MSVLQRWLVTALAALTLLVSVPAGAQSIPSPPSAKPTPAEEATAKKNFESGLRLYGEGSYGEALIAFEQSYRVGGRPSALKNIAQCHRNLKHFVEAYLAYEQMLASHEAQIPAPDKRTVQQALDELGVLTATVLVGVNETDAEIEIDGRSAGRSPMPKPWRIAASGGHVVRVSKPGFAKLEQPFTVDSQQDKKIEVKLEPERTNARIAVREQSGHEVHVFVDGEDKGPAPWEGDLPAGEHSIEAKGPRYAAQPRKIVLAPKERLDLALDATSMLGRLRVTTVPATADIAIDGKGVGAGAWEGELAAGKHTIEVSLPGQSPQAREVMLGRGQTIVQEIPMIAAIAGGKLTSYEGIYVRLSLFVQFGGQPDNDVPGRTTDDGKFLGQAGAALRVGRAWDWYGAEAVGIVMFEHRDSSFGATDATTGNHIDFNDQSNAVNAFLGVGPRVTSKDDALRFTFGIAPGIMVRTFNPRRKFNSGNNTSPGTNPDQGKQINRFAQTDTSSAGTTGAAGGGSNDESFSSAGYTTFGFVMDAGILVGGTPGTKFYLGAQAWMDFAPKLVTGPDTRVPIPDNAFKEPGRGITLVDGAQFYLGPTFGIQFGH